MAWRAGRERVGRPICSLSWWDKFAIKQHGTPAVKCGNTSAVPCVVPCLVRCRGEHLSRSGSTGVTVPDSNTLSWYDVGKFYSKMNSRETVQRKSHPPDRREAVAATRSQPRIF